METGIEINVKMRLIGYYMSDDQFMRTETVFPEKAEELAALMKITYDSIVESNLITDEIRKIFTSNTVFVFRTEDGRLNAYQPKYNIARLTKVNIRHSASLPQKYRKWFYPGEDYFSSAYSISNIAEQSEILIKTEDPDYDFAQKEIEDAQNNFKLNHTMPYTEDYYDLIREIFDEVGEESSISLPITITSGENVRIGNRVKIQPNVQLIGTAGIIIEDDVVLGNNVTIISAKRDSKRHDHIKGKTVVIKRGAYIGAGAIILPGVIIGEGAVIGEATHISKKVNPYTFVANRSEKFVKDI